jgi:hypothetical protein
MIFYTKTIKIIIKRVLKEEDLQEKDFQEGLTKVFLIIFSNKHSFINSFNYK